MFIKGKNIIIVVIVFLTICTVIGVSKYKEWMGATRTIKGRVDIGGYSLMVNGYGKGQPTVIFESGKDSSNQVWQVVQDEISKKARTFSYDRAGVGGSDETKSQGTSLDEVHELYTLLNNAKVDGPYIIVAHSIGGYNARLFAATYPEEVLGIVFVDSSHEDQFKFNSGLFELNVNQVKEARKKDALRNIPIVVLTSGKNAEWDRWLDCQKDLATLSNYSEHIVVKDIGHYIHTEKPQVVIDSIEKLIDKAHK